jgi:hypothetical protein
MRTSKRSWNARQILAIVSAVSIFALCVSWCITFEASVRPKSTPESVRATWEAETLLTEVHGAEVGKAIEDFWSTWGSLEARRDPGIQSQVATGPFLERMGYADPDDPIYDNAPFWTITESASVQSVHVLEWKRGRRFKAVACVTKQTDEITKEWVFLKSLPPREFRGVYVFVRKDDTWKLSGFFDVTDRDRSWRDWDYAQEWLKEIIRDLPEWEPCE